MSARQREGYIYIYIYKPAYYATPEATNTPNNGRGFAIGRERRARGGIVLNYNNSSAKLLERAAKGGTRERGRKGIEVYSRCIHEYKGLRETSAAMVTHFLRVTIHTIRATLSGYPTRRFFRWIHPSMGHIRDIC